MTDPLQGPEGPFQQVLPGMYLDRDGNAVFNIAEIVLLMGLEDTPENRHSVGQELQEYMAAHADDEMEIIWRSPGDQRWRRRKG